MINRQDECLFRTVILKDLRQGRAVEGINETRVHRSGEQLVFPLRRDCGGFVDDCLFNRVPTNRAGCDVGIRPRASGGVQTRHQVRNGVIRQLARAKRFIVFNLHHADDIRVNYEERRQDFVALAGEFQRSVRAAAAKRARRAADGRAGIQRGEVVEHIKTGHLQGTGHLKHIRSRRAGVHSLIFSARGGLNAVLAEVVIHHANHVAQLVPAAEDVIQGEFQTVGVPGGVRVGGFTAVIQEDAVEAQFRVPGSKASRVWFVQRGELHKALGAQHNLTKLVKVVVFHDGEFLRNTHVHALEFFEVQQAGDGQAEVGWFNAVAG